MKGVLTPHFTPFRAFMIEGVLSICNLKIFVLLFRDACGVGFIVRIDGSASHHVIEDAERLSGRMVHRGACGADNDTGDGAGALVGIPHPFYKDRLK